jgi:hypothetical protein
MFHKGQVGECKILSSYMAYMPHIRYLLYLINKYNIQYYGYSNFY